MLILPSKSSAAKVQPKTYIAKTLSLKNTKSEKNFSFPYFCRQKRLENRLSCFFLFFFRSSSVLVHGVFEKTHTKLRFML